jgi:hypothetical protein
MSSWANRHVLRKRDLSQIPSQFLPPIIPRSEQIQVKQSELFQQNSIAPSNEIVYPFSSQKSSIQSPPIQQLQITTLKQIEKPSPSAIELTHQNMSYVFVILRQIQSVIDNLYWISCYNSIRKYYTNKIIIIDDNSTINTVNGNLVNTEVIKSEFNGSGEILAYYYFNQYKWADYMIFLQDTMLLHRPFHLSELEGSIHFHWHFIDSSTSVNQSKMMTLLSSLKNNSELLEEIKNSNQIWKGCFSSTSIIHSSVVEFLQDKYNLFTILTLMIRNQNDRELFERILGRIIMVEHFADDESLSNFGNIMSYPNAFQQKSIDQSIQTIQQTNYNTAIIKVWK